MRQVVGHIWNELLHSPARTAWWVTLGIVHCAGVIIGAGLAS